MVTPMAPTVLDRLMDEIRSTHGPRQLEALARRVGVQVSALPGMLETLERKGILSLPAESGESYACSAACGHSCTGLETCPFIADVRAPQPVVLRRPHDNG